MATTALPAAIRRASTALATIFSCLAVTAAAPGAGGQQSPRDTPQQGAGQRSAPATINVSPGAYVLTARVTRQSGEETAFVPITVGFGDVSGITVAAAPGVTLTGTVVAAPGDTLPAAMTLEVTAYSTRMDEVRAAPVGRGDGSFTVTNLAGLSRSTWTVCPTGGP